MRVDGVPPGAILAPAEPGWTTPQAGFIVAGEPRFALLNRADEFRFEAWTLVADRPGEPLPLEMPSARAYIEEAVGLPGGSILLAISRYEPRPKLGLYVLDPATRGLSKISDIDSDIADPYRYFEAGAIAPDATLVVYYSGQTRITAERYFNAYNHLLLFTRRYAQGLPLATIGIDRGNVAEWAVVGQKLYLRLSDGRDVQNPRETSWSLDLSKVLTP